MNLIFCQKKTRATIKALYFHKNKKTIFSYNSNNFCIFAFHSGKNKKAIIMNNRHYLLTIVLLLSCSLLASMPSTAAPTRHYALLKITSTLNTEKQAHSPSSPRPE